jgi:Mn-dependent DtxR family transcriptional regulator
MKIQEAAENYLETILIQQNRMGQIRSIDICNALGFSKPTVSVVMKNFREEGYVLVDENGYITLTDKGLAIAEKMYERHEIIARFLMTLGVDEDTAYKDSCKIEHDISDLSFECMKKHYLNNR